jgi:hypothetical protein
LLMQYLTFEKDFILEMAMSAPSKLHKQQAALQERGVVDVKFCFPALSHNAPNSEVANNAADFLEAMHDENRYTVVEGIGDKRA